MTEVQTRKLADDRYLPSATENVRSVLELVMQNDTLSQYIRSRTERKNLMHLYERLATVPDWSTIYETLDIIAKYPAIAQRPFRLTEAAIVLQWIEEMKRVLGLL